MNNIPNVIPALPEILLCVSCVVFLMLGVFQSKKSMRLISYLSIAVLFVLILIVYITNVDNKITFSGLFIVNDFTSFSKIMIIIATILTLILVLPWSYHENVKRFEFPILILFSTLGMMMMISANDLISIYVGLELQSLSLYVLASFKKDDNRSAESGVKYFILGALASGLLLYGFSLIYGFTGTTSFSVLSTSPALNKENVGLIIGIVFVLSGFAFKISAVPFHMWTPDVYEGAPTPVTAFFSVAPKIASLCLFLRLLYGPFYEIIFQWQQIIFVLSIASMLWGSIAAIAQQNIKRLMAYSSIGHVGYALVGLASATQEGARGMLYYMLIYLIMNMGSFAVILSMKIKQRYVEEIADLSGLSKSKPIMAFSLSLLMFSMAGIPPLAGFFGKYFIFIAAIESGLIPLAIIGVLSSVIGAFYYLRIIKVMYFDDASEVFDKLDFSTGFVMLISALLVVLFIFVPEPMLSGADSAALALFIR